MRLIGILGKKGTGKSTSADYLLSKYSGFGIEKSFADPLKKMCAELFMFTNEQVYGTIDVKEMPDANWFGRTPRDFLQKVGTDWLRNDLALMIPELGKNFFVYRFSLWYNTVLETTPTAIVIIPDVRFQNEVDYIQKMGGIVIKIERLNIDNADDHESEKEIDLITTYNYLINNDHSISDLHKNLDQVMDGCVTKIDT